MIDRHVIVKRWGTWGVLLTALSAAVSRPATAATAAPPPVDPPPHVRSDPSVKYDFDIVYVRAPRSDQKVFWANTEPPTVNPPGADLVVLHPDGTQDVLVDAADGESLADPQVSFDGKWVYFAQYHEVRPEKGKPTRGGADVYKVNVATREVVRLTHQERTRNEAAIDPRQQQGAPAFTFNLGPCPLAGGRVAFVSDRNGYRGVKDVDTALQLFVMDDDGANVELIGAMNLGGAMHPVALRDGRILFSSAEGQGARIGEQWGLWSIWPDGTEWEPMFSAFVGGSSSLHFHAQLSDGDIVVEHYYPGATTQGFGSLLKFPGERPAGEPAFGPAYTEDPRNVTRARANDVKHRYVKFPFTPVGLRIVTEFTTDNDVPPNSLISDLGKVTHPAAGPDNHLLLVWSPPTSQRGDPQKFDSGIYLVKGGEPVDHPSKMRLVLDDPQYQEMWPRALAPYKRIYGIDEPANLPRLKNDGTLSKHLPAGTPFGLVGTATLSKRETYPNGVVPAGSVTGGSRNENDVRKVFMELGSVYRGSDTNNWKLQGADAGRYTNDDIWGIRILALEPVTHAGREARQFGHASGRNGAGGALAERIRILGEFPVRKFDKDGKQPLDPDGHPDTSFLAKVPADVAWTFQTIDRNGMVLNMAQTWHQVRPGEVRNNCGGCHAHSQKPTEFRLTRAAADDYAPFDLTARTPLFTTRARDESGKTWDADKQTGLRYADRAVVNVEFRRDVEPILRKSCVACHTGAAKEPPGGLVLDDQAPVRVDGHQLPLPGTYVRLAWDNEAKYGPKPIGRQWDYRQQMSRYVRKMQSRRSMMVWKVYGRRLDGFDNDDLPTERVAGDVSTLEGKGQRIEPTSEHLRIADLDLVGSQMPPAEAVAGTYVGPDGKRVKVEPLSDEDRLTIARWIDLGCPIDLDYDPAKPEQRGYGWARDDQRPTLTLTLPRAAAGGAIDRILVGMHDYDSGLDDPTFKVTADVAIDGVAPGENLAARFKPAGNNVWEMRLDRPIASATRGSLRVSVADRQGNVSRAEHTIATGRD